MCSILTYEANGSRRLPNLSANSNFFYFHAKFNITIKDLGTAGHLPYTVTNHSLWTIIGIRYGVQGFGLTGSTVVTTKGTEALENLFSCRNLLSTILKELKEALVG